MNRRSFLTAIAGAFVAPDPERALWVPGRKLISVPKPQVLTLDEFSVRHIAPAVRALAESLDLDLLLTYDRLAHMYPPERHE